MDIQFVLTEDAPTFEFFIPADRNNFKTQCMAIISGIAPAIEADPDAEPPVAAVEKNAVTLEYALPAATDAATGAELAKKWVASGINLDADGMHAIAICGAPEGEMRFVLSGVRDMRIRFFILY